MLAIEEWEPQAHLGIKTRGRESELHIDWGKKTQALTFLMVIPV